MPIPDKTKIFQQLADTNPLPIALVHNHLYTYVNKAFIYTFGYTALDIEQGLDIRTMISDKDQDHWQDTYSHSQTVSGSLAPHYFTLLSKEKTALTCFLHCTAVHEDDTSFIGLIFNPTPAALRENEKKFRTIFDNAAEGILITITATQKFLYANAMIAKMLGYTPGEVFQLALKDIHPPDVLIHILKSTNLQKSTGKIVLNDILCIRKDGSLFYADISAKTIFLEGRRCNVGFFTDVTERHQTQEALEKSEAYLRSIFRVAPAGIGVVINRILTHANDRVCTMTGYHSNELIGQNARMLYPSQEDYEYVEKEKYQQIKQNGTGTVETRWIHKNGSIIDVLLSSTPLNEDDLSQGVAFTALDITPQITLNKNLKKTVHEKELLIKEVHHRVKNNLQIITSLLSLQSRYISNPHDLELFNDSRGRIRSMALIHEQLYQIGDYTKINFSRYVYSITTELSRAYGVKAQQIAIDFTIDDIHINMEQAIPCGLIINELLSNIYKYAFPESFTQEPAITISFKQYDAETPPAYTLMIADNGIGLPKDIDFDATKSLGMHLIKVLAEGQLEGNLDITTKAGSNFLITFPQTL